MSVWTEDVEGVNKSIGHLRGVCVGAGYWMYGACGGEEVALTFLKDRENRWGVKSGDIIELRQGDFTFPTRMVVGVDRTVPGKLWSYYKWDSAGPGVRCTNSSDRFEIRVLDHLPLVLPAALASLRKPGRRVFL